MKSLNIFKKRTSINSVTKSSTAQKLDKNQLGKVIGGTDTTENKANTFATGLVVKGSGN